MAATHKNRVQMTVTGTPGIGTITLNAATSGYQSLASAYGADAVGDFLFVDGTAWEVARDCVYTHSGTTLSRGTLEASSTGSAISLTSAAVVSMVATAEFGNATENVVRNGGHVFVQNDNINTQTLTLGAYNRLRGNSDSPSSGVLRTEVTDQEGWWDAGIARFQPTRAGRYFVSMSVQCAYTGSSAFSLTIAALYKNGSLYLWGARNEVTAANPATGGTIAAVVELNGSTDYLEPYVYADMLSGSGVLRNIAHGNWFSARYLGQ